MNMEWVDNATVRWITGRLCANLAHHDTNGAAAFYTVGAEWISDGWGIGAAQLWAWWLTQMSVEGWTLNECPARIPSGAAKPAGADQSAAPPSRGPASMG